MENTIENKGKFISQYWTQDVLRLSDYPNTKIQINSQTIFERGYNNNSYLELTPLSMISDEDSIEVANILSFCRHVKYWDVLNMMNRNDLQWVQVIGTASKKDDSVVGGNIFIHKSGRIEWDWDDKNEFSDYELRIYSAYQYLLSKGYALPYIGLSVDEMIEYGWLKLKTE